MRKYFKPTPRLILDLGCGTGYMTEVLSRNGHRVVGTDLRPEGLFSAREISSDAFLVQADATHLPIKDNQFDGALVLDVLEHVDDQILSSELCRILRPGGSAIVAVPAFPWLWSYRDKGARHRRRYTRNQLSNLFAMKGFQIEEVRYYQFFLLPLVVLTRLLGKGGPRLRDLEEQPTRRLNTLFISINDLEIRLGEFIRWPFGSSLVIVVRKR